MGIASNVPSRAPEIRALRQAKVPCASCYELGGMEFESIHKLDLHPALAIGTLFATDGSQRGNRAIAIFRCIYGCHQKVAISGYGTRGEVFSIAGSEVVEYLHIDNIAPAIPLFELRPDFSPIAFQDTLRVFRLYWSDPTAAMQTVRKVVESLVIERWLKSIEVKPPSAEHFENWQKEGFDRRVGSLFVNEIERRALRALWNCGSVHSHFNGDEDSQLRLTEHLDHAISLLHFALLQVSGNTRVDAAEEPESLRKLEKFFSKKAKRDRLETALGSIPKA